MHRLLNRQDHIVFFPKEVYSIYNLHFAYDSRSRGSDYWYLEKASGHTRHTFTQTNKHAHNISKLFKKHFLKLRTFGGLY